MSQSFGSLDPQNSNSKLDASTKSGATRLLSFSNWREFPWQRVNWVSAVFLIVTPPLAILLTSLYIWNHGWSWGLTGLLIGSFTISNLLITVGYHRLFAHRAFEAPSWVRFTLVMLGAGCFQGTCLQWSTDHRRHHRVVDSDEDPYTIGKGFFFAHIGWMLMKDQHPESKRYVPDLANDRWIKMQHDYYLPIAIFSGWILPGLVAWACGLGFWPGVLVGGLLRIVLSEHSTFLINSAAHTFGGQPYTDKNSARDNWFMAILTFGEGYHNYHHFFQADYRNGVRWYQWDPTKWAIWTMSALGMARRLKRVSAAEILKAKIAMEQKRMAARGASHERLQALRDRIEASHKRLQELQFQMKAEMKLRVAQRAERRRVAQAERQTQFAELRAEMALAQVEFRNAVAAWQAYARAWRTAIQT